MIHRSPDRLDAVVMAVAARWYASFGGTSELDGPARSESEVADSSSFTQRDGHRYA